MKFPAVRCDPKPIQKRIPILLGARGEKAMERVIRTYDGWVPIAGRPASFKRDIDAIKKLASERGRNPDTLHISGFVGPGEDGISSEDLKLYKEAGRASARAVLAGRCDQNGGRQDAWRSSAAWRQPSSAPRS